MALLEEFEQQGTWLFKYRSYVPIVALVVGYLLYLRTELYPETFILEETPYEIYYEMGALLVCLLGLVIRVYTVGYTPANTSGRNHSEQLADSLNTTGSYSMVRHPLYVGNFFMWVGPALLTGNIWFVVSFVLFFLLFYERIMFTEEQFLRRKFGDAYIKWSENIPAFIPRFKNFKKPPLSFSWKKVLKKEKNGLFAAFLIFSFFDVSGELVEGNREFNYFLIGATVLTGLAYVVLKILKKSTNVLNEAGR